jgi:adenosylcobinamide kinase/adenosylcobinamide-phosphate guanylyltransferase
MTRIALVLGGTRSGKSRYAVELARQRCGQRVCYLATARQGDPELDDRIAAHRRERPAAWPTREVATDLAAAIAAAPPDHQLLIDSLTLWVAALLEANEDVSELWPAAADRLGRHPPGAILVSDEVGLGVVPDSPLGRRFRDELGWLNQQVAALADDVVLCVAGLPIQLRGP